MSFVALIKLLKDYIGSEVTECLNVYSISLAHPVGMCNILKS